VDLQNSLLRLAKDYRGFFAPDAAVDAKQIEAIRVTEKSSNQKKVLETILKQLKSSLDDIHKSDAPIEWSQIQETEDRFRGICRALQETIMLPSYLCRIPENSAVLSDFVDVAELALRSLLSIRSERAILVESTRKWSSKTKPVSVPPLDQPPRSSFPLKVWISTLFDSFPRTGSAVDKDQTSSVPVAGLLAHEDPSLGAPQNLFRAVMESIAFTVQDKKNRLAVGKAANRLVEIHDLMPSALWLHSPELAKLVLEMLWKAGTLESARTSRQIFQRPNKRDELPVALVLHAYVEAAKYEEDSDVLETVALECLDVLERLWNDNAPPPSDERILQGSLVLKCFSVAEMGSISEMCERADVLVKRVLGRDSYDRLMKDIFSDEATEVDSRALPLINYLVQLYASSGDVTREEQARKMLRYMVQGGQKDLGRSAGYPNVDACNLVLETIWNSYQGKGGIEESKGRQDLNYAYSLVKYMLRRGEKGCLPDDETFLITFRLLTKISPNDMGDRAEDLLSKMEVCRYFSRSTTVNITLSTYHRVLGCWLESAKSGTSKNACRRAMKLLEKLEIQSSPLLLSNRDMQITTVKNLYDSILQPSIRTYKLLLNIYCAEAEQSQDDNTDVLLAVFKRMVERDLISDDPDTVKLLEKCLAFLPEDSDQRLEVEAYLKEVTANLPPSAGGDCGYDNSLTHFEPVEESANPANLPAAAAALGGDFGDAIFWTHVEPVEESANKELTEGGDFDTSFKSYYADQDSQGQGDVSPQEEISASLSSEQLACLTVVQLKEKLRDSGVKVSGTKAELITRLLS
jgi:hypothetical protein